MKTNYFILLIFLVNYTNSALSQTGISDNSFGNNGIVITDIDTKINVGYDVMEQSDGKILVEATNEDNLTIVRYNPDGTLDNSFNNSGRVTTPLNGSAYFTEYDPYTFAIDSNKKIVLAGSYINSSYNNDFSLVRYNNNGTLDSSFGLNGIVKTHINGLQGSFQSVQIQTDGKILAVGGVADSIFGQGLPPSIEIARYNANGSLDGSFGLNGLKFFSEYDITGNSVAIQKDGKIIIGGGGNGGVIIRLLSNGNLDSTFGNNGIVNKTGRKVIIQNDNKILSLSGANIIRLNSDGSFDNNFGSNGVSQSNLEYSNDIALQPDGRILIAGEDSGNFAISRFDADGSLDYTFTPTGVINTDINHGSFDFANSVAMQADGKILVAGATGPTDIGTVEDIAVVRYLSGLNGINEINKNETIASFIFPNPVSDNTTLYYNIAFSSEVSISITDICGKILYKCAKVNASIGKHQEQIFLANIPSGVYFLNLKTVYGSSSIKIIKK